MVEGKKANEASNSNVGFEKRRFGHNWNLKMTHRRSNNEIPQCLKLKAKSSPRLNPLDLVKAKLVHN